MEHAKDEAGDKWRWQPWCTVSWGSLEWRAAVAAYLRRPHLGPHTDAARVYAAVAPVTIAVGEADGR